MRRRTAFGLVVLLLGVAGTSVGWFFGQTYAEQRLQIMLSAAIGQPVSLTLRSIGLSQSQLANIRIGNEPAMTIPTLALDYTPSELLHGRLRQLALDNLQLTLRQTVQGWQFDGFPPASPSATAAPFALPMTPDAVQALPLAATTIGMSQITITAPQWQLTLPFSLHWQQATPATLTLASDAPTLQTKAGMLTSTTAQLQFKHNPGLTNWQGGWQLRDIALPALPIATPLLQATGTTILQANALSVTGNIGSADHAWQGSFNLRLPLPSGAPQLQIEKASMPLFGGFVALGKTGLIIDGTHPLTFAPQLQKLPLADLLRTLTGLGAKGEGTISGTVPVTYLTNGTLRFGAGQLQADKPGVLQLPPEAIPGDNPQMTLLRELLQDLHYTKLLLGLTGLPDGKLEVQLSLEGNNPAVQQGKMVKFNIKLNGAVLDLLTQNLQLLTNPQQFLTKDKP
ncbi:MAG: YdbH domain-containing protein [Alphaproteobacteria bacterium]|nr:YdbH domain-containing protein [Alphaproteobacteria bacterium]